MSRPDEERELLSAIGALEARRNILGDAVVETSIAALRKKLSEISKRSQEEQRRRNATVLFADVSGFTSICRRNDAENVTEAINALWEALDGIIVSRGGTVDKHIGDCVMAVWGASGVKEDDTVRAVDAALAMQEKASSISSRSRGLIPPFRIRIGLHTGPVFLTPVGLGEEYTAMGDTVNVASRLQNLAPLGSVIISRSTWKHLRGLFICRELPPVKVKGIDDEMVTFLVEGRPSAEAQGPETSVLGRETRMIGRSEELDLLTEILNRTLSEGGTAAVTVCGEAGIGKSRLLHEFRKTVCEAGRPVVFFNARCTPGMEDMPCAVFRDILGISAGILDTHDSSTAVRKIVSLLSEQLTEDEAARACFYAGYNTGAAGYSHGEGDAASGRTSLIEFFVKTARRTPLLLCLEDLHWADTVSLDLIETLTDRCDGSMMVVCLARPPLLERRPAWGTGSDWRMMKLSALSGDQCREMVRSLLGGFSDLPRSLAELIGSNSEGNPFYVEELVKMLVEEGVIDTETGIVDTKALMETRVPGTLTGVLQARLDSLSREERRVLQVASVIGRIFWDMTLGDLCGHGVPDQLTSAEKRDLIRKMERSALSGSGEYLFKHAILRDVTYETVLLKARRKYHGMVADWLIQNVGDRLSEFQGLVASHFELAEDWPAAVEWLEKAGGAALKTSGYQEAVSLFTRALSVPAEHIPPLKEAELRLRRSVALEKLTRYGEADEELQKVLAVSREEGSHLLAGEALSLLTWIATVTGDRKNARKLAREACEEAGKAGNSDLLARVTMRMGDYEEVQEYEPVLSHFKAALDIYTGSGNEDGAATALLNMGNVAMAFRRPDDAAAFYERSLVKYRALGSRWGIANCLGNLGTVASARGDIQRAVEYYRESLEASVAIGDREGETICNLNLGDAALSLDQQDKALVHHTAALRIARDTGLRPLMLGALRGWAEAMIRGGRPGGTGQILSSILADEALHPFEKEKIRQLLHEADPAGDDTVSPEQLADRVLNG